MTLTTAEALGTQFAYNGATKKGLNLADKTLEWFAKKGTESEKAAAAVLLRDTVETISNSVYTREVKKQAKPQPDCVSEDDDGFGPVGVVESPTSHPPVAVKAAVPHVTKPTPEDMPNWARELFAEVRRAHENAALAADSAVAIMEKMTVIATTLKTWASESKPTTAPGIGQGGGAGQASGGKPVKKEHATRAVLEHKDGKVRVSFWDDDKPHLNFAVINATKTPAQWSAMMPWLPNLIWEPMKLKEWVAAFPDYEDYNVITGAWEISYTDSDKLNSKGNPYKDIAKIEKSR